MNTAEAPQTAAADTPDPRHSLEPHSQEPLTLTLATDASQLVRWASRYFGRSPEEVASGVIAEMLEQTFEGREKDDFGHTANYHVVFAQRSVLMPAPVTNLRHVAESQSGPAAPAKDQLLNCRQLAAALGHGPGYVSAMKAAGYVMDLGTRTTLRHAMKWLRDNPGFRATGYARNSTRRGRGRPRREHAHTA